MLWQQCYWCHDVFWHCNNIMLIIFVVSSYWWWWHIHVITVTYYCYCLNLSNIPECLSIIVYCVSIDDVTSFKEKQVFNTMSDSSNWNVTVSTSDEIFNISRLNSMYCTYHIIYLLEGYFLVMVFVLLLR